MQQTKNDTGLRAISQLIFSPQDETQHVLSTAFDETTPYEDAELPSLEACILDALIRAVLISNKEEMDPVESLDAVFSY